MYRIRLLTRHLQSPLHQRLLPISRPPVRTANMSSAVPEKMQALQIQSQGGLDVLAMQEIAVPEPKEGEVLMKVEYAGVNYIDTYQRSGLYKLNMPFVLGNEAAGKVVKVGSGLKGINEGDLVATYCSGGAFASYVSVPRSRVFKLPQGVDAKAGAASVLQGLTAWTLVKEAYPLKKGDWVLVHAAAGGVGLLLCQMASYLGAHVIGTTSTPEKAQLAKDNGAEHIINYTKDSIVEKIMELTGGVGVQGIYDGVGKDTWEDDFKVIARKGTICTFGNASGAVEPFAPLKLAAKNVKVCRPTLPNYVATQDEFESYCKDLFDLIHQGIVKIRIHKEYEFSAQGIRQAQEDITGRGTTGKLVVKVA